MTFRLLHPSDAALSRFAEAPADADASPRLKRHLARCPECRRHVAFVRDLPVRVAELDGPVAGDELLGRIRHRLAAHEITFIPVAAAGTRATRTPWLAAAAAVVVAVLAWAAWPVSSATAGATTGDLRFTPGRLTGGRIEVRYHDAGLFAGANRLVLRARYRAADNEPYNRAARQHVVATLVRTSNSDFRASIAVPDSVVYAAFAVENEDGTRIDDNAHRLWFLMDETANGQPTEDALEQRARDLMGENMELAMRVLQQRARLYADRPSAWGGVVALERFMLGKAHDDSTVAEHCARLQRFDAAYRARPSVSPDDADAIHSYAVQLDGDKCPALRPIANYWHDRLLRDTSAAAPVVLWRYETAVDSARNDPARALQVAERYWPGKGMLASFLYNNGFLFAMQAKDSAGLVRWADRNVEHTPDVADYYYGRLLTEPATRAVGLERLRTTLRQLETRRDSLRPLEHTVAEQARLDSAAARQVLVSIGNALIEDGRTAAGLDTLELATRGGWDPALFRRVAQTLLRVGDTTRAFAVLARVAADPSTDTAASDSIARIVRGRRTDAQWQRLLRSADSTMRAEVLADAVNMPVKDAPRLQASDGATTDLAALTKGRVGVVVFWSRFCAPSRQQFPMLATPARQLSSRGIAFVPITSERPSDAVKSYVADAKLSVPVYHDVWGQAGRAFQDYGTPMYFIVDAAGRIRFRYTTLAKVLTQAVVLQRAERLADR